VREVKKICKTLPENCVDFWDPITLEMLHGLRNYWMQRYNPDGKLFQKILSFLNISQYNLLSLDVLFYDFLHVNKTLLKFISVVLLI